jgi:hypothetical protein
MSGSASIMRSGLGSRKKATGGGFLAVDLPGGVVRPLGAFRPLARLCGFAVMASGRFRSSGRAKKSTACAKTCSISASGAP